MKRLFIFLTCSIAILALIIGVVAWLSLQPLPWHDPPDYSDTEITSLADLAERRMNEEFHKIRPTDEVWHLRITADAVNAWLSGRLEGWLTHDQQLKMPEEVHGPQIHITNEGIWLAANIEIDGATPRPLAVELWIWIEDGVMYVEPISVRLGRIPVPLTFFESVMTELRENVRGVEAVVPLMDDREVHILGIELEESAFVLTCQTHLP